ncbi:protein ripply3 [Polyodon spathula]|uniref:protein ripply3 n=1 Tax=Polyodon spathula TaxID=7913 RepID=UPI001B7F5B32|nr:protein ripply3 [Polyodon spathula]
MESTVYTLKAQVTHACQCCRHMHLPPNRGPAKCSPAMWRPWIQTNRDIQMSQSQTDSMGTRRTGGALGFQHPVRLYMPKSKSHDYLNSMGEKVLASFPVQATIHFYNDDSDSEEDEEEIQEERGLPRL